MPAGSTVIHLERKPECEAGYHGILMVLVIITVQLRRQGETSELEFVQHTNTGHEDFMVLHEFHARAQLHYQPPVQMHVGHGQDGCGIESIEGMFHYNTEPQ